VLKKGGENDRHGSVEGRRKRKTKRLPRVEERKKPQTWSRRKKEGEGRTILKGIGTRSKAGRCWVKNIQRHRKGGETRSGLNQILKIIGRTSRRVQDKKKGCKLEINEEEGMEGTSSMTMENTFPLPLSGSDAKKAESPTI